MLIPWLLLASGASLTQCLDLDPESPESLRKNAAPLVFNALSSYVANASGTPAYLVGTLPRPLYWWHGGATFGAVVDYWAATGDTSYNPSLTQALLTQAGPAGDLMPSQFRSEMGNDDIAFWAFPVLSALEYGLPFPNSTGASVTSWLQLADRVFNGMVARWETATCGGGLRWQVPPENKGYNYKNSISNGGFFQIAARLARYTGNSTYVEWADRIWNWSSEIGLIDNNDLAVYDGAGVDQNCTQYDSTQWSYNSGIYLGGVAYLYNATNGSTIWNDRLHGLVAQANRTFFSPFPNSTNVLYEQACEFKERNGAIGCNQDQVFFKGFLARWLGKASVLAPSLAPSIAPLLSSSARGAAVDCSGYVLPTEAGAQPSENAVLPQLGINGTLCGPYFYSTPENISSLSKEGFFSNLEVGQKVGHPLTALEVLVANIPLVDKRPESEGGPRYIRVGPGVTIA